MVRVNDLELMANDMHRPLLSAIGRQPCLWSAARISELALLFVLARLQAGAVN